MERNVVGSQDVPVTYQRDSLPIGVTRVCEM